MYLLNYGGPCFIWLCSKQSDDRAVGLFRTFCPLLLFPLTSSLLVAPSLFVFSVSDQREKERETRLQELRQQREERSQKGRAGGGAGEVVTRKVEKSADGSTLSQVTKTDRFAQSGR